MIVVAPAIPVAAQDATGRVVGIVADPSGSVVPKATVTVTNAETGVSQDTVTADDGSYVNLTIGKITGITELVKLDIQADFFNALNHAEFNTPNTTITRGTFGQISGTADPRIIQLSGPC